MQKTNKELLKNMALGCIKSTMPPGNTYLEQDRGALTVETFIEIGQSAHKVFIYARLETNDKDGAFVIIVDPSNELDDSAFRTTAHCQNSFNDMYKDKCLYAADYLFGLAFEDHPEFVKLQHEYSPR